MKAIFGSLRHACKWAHFPRDWRWPYRRPGFRLLANVRRGCCEAAPSTIYVYNIYIYIYIYIYIFIYLSYIYYDNTQYRIRRRRRRRIVSPSRSPSRSQARSRVHVRGGARIASTSRRRFKRAAFENRCLFRRARDRDLTRREAYTGTISLHIEREREIGMPI